MNFDEQVKDIKLAFSACISPKERRDMFMFYLMDRTFDRGAITAAMKQMNIQKDFTVTE